MSVKDLVVKPIKSHAANHFVRSEHYSGKVTQNSQIHLGVFWDNNLEGVLQFGPSLDKRKIWGLVNKTPWNGFIELNRMVFSDILPRNSESRALSVSFRIIKKHYPHIEWIISFADGTQCGDGTIYRASGFTLTGIRKNMTIWISPAGETISSVTLTDGSGALKNPGGSSSMKSYKEIGYRPMPGFQLRYIKFLDPSARERLTVPEIPFSKISEMGASMYLGVRAGSIDSDAPASSGEKAVQVRPRRSKAKVSK